MSFGDRLGLAGLALGLFAIAAPYLWADKKWIGWLSLSCGVALLVAWGWVELGTAVDGFSRRHVVVSSIVVFVVGGTLATALWLLAGAGRKPESQPVDDKKGQVTPPPQTEITAAKPPSSAPPVKPAIAPEVKLDAHLQPGPYANSSVFAGIVWDEAYSDVRLDISVGRAGIHDLDFLVSLDTTIMEVGQITQFPGCTAFPPSSNISAFTLQGTDKKGKNIAMPIDPTPGNAFGAPTYRVHCGEVFANVVVRFAIASRALNPMKPGGGFPDQLFAPRRDPQVIKVEGTYNAGGVTYPLKYSAKLERATEEN